MREPVLPPDVPQPLDRELLAWAAGFFDGEGSTIAKSDARRLDYFLLDVSVPQSGLSGIPEVLLKFQRAMLGAGVIRRQPDELMYKWCAGGGATSEMALALMWPWLGSIKRQQALKAIEVVSEQYLRGRRRRRPRYSPPLIAHGDPQPTNPVRLAFAWAAGFVDAEGYFGNPKKYLRGDGSVGLTIRASATQHGAPGMPAEVLVRMRELLGGRIERHGEVDDHKWVREGVLNVDWLVEELREWLGTVKLTQAAEALDAADQSRVRGNHERCIRGHIYDRVYVAPDGSARRKCSACARLLDRANRITRGGRSRIVRNPPTDPTRRYTVN